MGTIKKGALLLGDIAVFYAALAVMILARYRDIAAFHQTFAAHAGPFSAILIVWLLAFYWNGLFHYRAFGGRAWLVKAILRAVVIATVGSILALYLFPKFFELTPRTNLFLFAGIFFLFSYLFRVVTLRLSSSGKLNVIVIGSSPLTKEAVEVMRTDEDADYRLVRWIEDAKKNEIAKLPDMVRATNTQLVVMPHHLVSDFETLRAIYQVLPLEVSVMRFSDFYEVLFEKEPLKELSENWFLENVSTRRPFYDTVKRAADIAIALAAGTILLIPSLVIALLIKLTSHGPAIYTQSRMGKNGVPFTIYKFRTMRSDTTGPAWTEANDTRITGIGKFLRFTHLDEAPQIVNILKNDISLVGPRPESTALVAQYERFPYYEIRHIVKPGLTGWAQVRYKPSASLEEAYEKLCYDVYYIKHRSLFLDLVIFLRTVKYLFTSYAH